MVPPVTSPAGNIQTVTLQPGVVQVSSANLEMGRIPMTDKLIAQNAETLAIVNNKHPIPAVSSSALITGRFFTLFSFLFL